jgi:sortase A
MTATPSRSNVLKWIERALWTGGIAIGAWTLVVLAQNWYWARVPIPSEPASIPSARRLPGEDPSETSGTSGRSSRRVEAGAWLARLEAPAVRLKATVLEGSDDRTLRRAAGHIEYTPRPGEPGNIGIAGHRDTTFYPLRNLQVGDHLTLTTAKTVYEYRVARVWVVEPEDIRVLDPTSEPALTLVTCYPFTFVGNAPKRFIVRARLLSQRTRP